MHTENPQTIQKFWRLRSLVDDKDWENGIAKNKKIRQSFALAFVG